MLLRSLCFCCCVAFVCCFVAFACCCCSAKCDVAVVKQVEEGAGVEKAEVRRRLLQAGAPANTRQTRGRRNFHASGRTATRTSALKNWMFMGGANPHHLHDKTPEEAAAIQDKSSVSGAGGGAEDAGLVEEAKQEADEDGAKAVEEKATAEEAVALAEVELEDAQITEKTLKLTDPALVAPDELAAVEQKEAQAEAAVQKADGQLAHAEVDVAKAEAEKDVAEVSTGCCLT